MELEHFPEDLYNKVDFCDALPGNPLELTRPIQNKLVTNLNGNTTTSKLSISSIEQRQIMDVLNRGYIKPDI
jgi:hypothetical protein